MVINRLTPETAKLLGIDVIFAVPESAVNIAVLGDLAPDASPKTSVQIQPAGPKTNADGSTEIVTSPLPLPDNQTLSSPVEPFVVLQDRDVYGDDIGHVTKAVNAEQCQIRCTLTESCLAFTYNEKGNYCFLKSHATRVWWAQGNVSGYRRSLGSKINFYSLILKPSSTLRGEEYNFYLNSKTEECASICSGQQDCAGFTFSRHEQGRCSLKKGELTFQHQKSIIAGVKTSKSSKP